jgi:tRNA (mo5U34)-methyltransferase
MPTRSVSYRNFGLSVTVPERVAAAARRLRGAAQAETGLRYLDPVPAVTVKDRDPAHSLDFRDIADEEGSRQQELVGPGGDDELSRQIKSQTWYHTIELPGGVVTPGQFDHRPLLPRYGLPASLDGKRALDAATFNGFWAFHLEKLGADVVAIDLDDPAEWDFPEPVRKELISRGPREPIGTGFEIAHKALNSKVQRVSRSLYDLDPEVDGSFDLVHCSDVLLHLREPLRALERLRGVCSGDLLLTDVIDDDAKPGRYGPTMQYLGGWDDVNWWIPSLDVLVQLVIDAGFRDVRVTSVFNLPKTYEAEGYWRATLTAH